MKKVIALTLSALLCTAAMGTAEAATTEAPISTTALALPQEKMPSFITSGTSFLTKSITLEKSNYVPCTISADQLPAEEAATLTSDMKQFLAQLPMGQIQKQVDGHYATAMVFHWTYPVPKDASTDPFHDLFAGKKSANDALNGFNQLVTLAGPFGNAMVKSYVASMNEKNKTHMPEDIFSFSLRNTTPAASFNKKAYTFGTRLITEADGWTLPFYVKGYIWKKGNNYYLLGAFCADSEWDALSSDMDQLATYAMKS